MDPGYTVTPLSNYFFSIASSVVLAAVITLVTEKVLAKQAAALPLDPEEAARASNLGSRSTCAPRSGAGCAARGDRAAACSSRRSRWP